MAAGGAADTAAPPSAGETPESDYSGAEDFRRECRRSWARLIQKMYEVVPLICPDCGGRLEAVAFIDALVTAGLI